MLKDGKTSCRITSPLLALQPLLLLSSSYLSSWYVIHPIVFYHRFIKIAHLFPLFFVIWLDVTFPCVQNFNLHYHYPIFSFFFSKISEFNSSQKFIPKLGIILYLNFLSIKFSKVAYLHDLGPGVFFLDEWKYIIKRTLSSGPHTTLL